MTGQKCLCRMEHPAARLSLFKRFLEEKNISPLPWLGNWPSMNPIENVWLLLKRRLAKKTRTQLIVRIIHFQHHDEKHQETAQKCTRARLEELPPIVGLQNISFKYVYYLFGFCFMILQLVFQQDCCEYIFALSFISFS